MIAYIVVGVLFLLVVAFAVLARKEWHWVNIAFVILTFLAGTAACAGMAKVYSLRSAALRELAASEKLVEKFPDPGSEQLSPVYQAGLAVYGPDDSYSYSPDSLHGTNQALMLELIGQGRLWMNGAVEAKGENFLFKFKAPRAASENKGDQLKQVLLFAFADDGVLDLSYPSKFLGTFRVAEESLESLELKPEFVVAVDELAKWPSWSLFEKMPIDRNDVFFRANKIDSKDLKGRTAYRELLTGTILPAASFGLDPNSPEYEQFIDRFAFDGMSLGDIRTWILENKDSRKSERFDPSPDEVFVRYKFDDASARSYSVDSNGTLEIQGLFTTLGQANDQALHFGEDLKFVKGDEVLINRASADGYQKDDGTQIPPFSQSEPSVQEIGQEYHRKLIDFPYELKEMRESASLFERHTAETKIENEVTLESLNHAEAEVRHRDDVGAKLEQDLANLTNDKANIDALINSLKSQVDTMRQKMSELQQDIERNKKKLDGRD